MEGSRLKCGVSPVSLIGLSIIQLNTAEVFI